MPRTAYTTSLVSLLLLSLLPLTALPQSETPVSSSPGVTLPGCNGQSGGCTLQLTNDPWDPPPRAVPRSDVCGIDIAWQNTNEGRKCYVNCGNQVVDPNRGIYTPFPGDTCPDNRPDCGDTIAWQNANPAGDCHIACGTSVTDPRTNNRITPFPWQEADSSAACYRDCGHPTRPWQNPDPAGDCYAACGQAVTDTYHVNPHTPFPWQTSSITQSCFACGDSVPWQNANPSAACYAACDQIVSDNVKGTHTPFSTQTENRARPCYTAGECGTDTRPWTYAPVSNPTQCEASCGETVTDAENGAHTPFPFQDTDEAAQCYCGTPYGLPWQSTDPDALCYEPPCGSPGKPYELRDDHPDSACPLDCDEADPDGTVWFPAQNTDRDAACYIDHPGGGCGTSNPWQYTRPEEECFACFEELSSPPEDHEVLWQSTDSAAQCYRSANCPLPLEDSHYAGLLDDSGQLTVRIIAGDSYRACEQAGFFQDRNWRVRCYTPDVGDATKVYLENISTAWAHGCYQEQADPYAGRYLDNMQGLYDARARRKVATFKACIEETLDDDLEFEISLNVGGGGSFTGVATIAAGQHYAAQDALEYTTSRGHASGRYGEWFKLSTNTISGQPGVGAQLGLYNDCPSASCIYPPEHPGASIPAAPACLCGGNTGTPWQNDEPSDACYMACGDEYTRAGATHRPFPWQYDDAATACYGCGDEPGQTPFQGDDPNARCYEPGDEICTDVRWQYTKPEDECFACFEELSTPPEAHEVLWQTDNPDGQCYLACGEEYTQAGSTHRPFPWQYDDAATACYGCGDEPGQTPFQGDDPDGQCYLAPQDDCLDIQCFANGSPGVTSISRCESTTECKTLPATRQRAESVVCEPRAIPTSCCLVQVHYSWQTGGRDDGSGSGGGSDHSATRWVQAGEDCTMTCPAIPEGIEWSSPDTDSHGRTRRAYCASSTPIPAMDNAVTSTVDLAHDGPESDRAGAEPWQPHAREHTQGSASLRCVRTHLTPRSGTNVFHGPEPTLNSGSGAPAEQYARWWQRQGDFRGTCEFIHQDCNAGLQLATWTGEYQEHVGERRTLTRTAHCRADNALAYNLPFVGTIYQAPFPDAGNGEPHTLYDTQGEEQGTATFECNNDTWTPVATDCAPDQSITAPEVEALRCPSRTFTDVQWGYQGHTCTPDSGSNVTLPEGDEGDTQGVRDTVAPTTGHQAWKCVNYVTQARWTPLDSHCTANLGDSGPGPCPPGETPTELPIPDEGWCAPDCAPRYECR